MTVRTFAFAAFLLATSSAAAAPRLAAIFADHGVLQQGRAIPVWGTAAPGERLTVTLGDASREVAAGRDGAWRVELPAMPAGGPHELVVAGASGRAGATDLLVGDVWLCSGQSNMELTVSSALNGANDAASANDPQLRLLTVPHLTGAEPASDFAAPVAWRAAEPDSVRAFSAACYHMARALRRARRVPVGAIAASWGGSPVRAWMDEAGAAATLPREHAQVSLHRRDPVAALRAFGDEWASWWRGATGDAAGREPWNASDRLNWSPVPFVGLWESWGEPRLAEYDGMVWFRRRVTLTPAQAAQPATLSLGVVDEFDFTLVNGAAVGGRFSWESARDYPVAAGLLRAGANEIMVNAIDGWGGGGMAGPAERLRLTFADGSVVPLGDGWEYAIVDPPPGLPPTPPWEAPFGLGQLYNGMIAPLRDYALTGVAWYQGEADVWLAAGYADRLAAMMSDWRRRFGRADLPFLIVGLANFGPPTAAPAASAWAELRDQQRLAAARDPHARLVTAMDLGERDDVHPANKTEVGRRLARAALSLAHGAAQPAGPQPVRARRAGDAVVVDFAGVTGALRSWSGTRALAFELCADTQESCRYADAVASGSEVRIALDGRPVTRVRYAWADSPVTNLYDEAQLPAPPFELVVE